jgi:trans-aconitate 2-methyltransferase
MSWKPDVYLQFAASRTRPAADLLARVQGIRPGRIIDLGCGPGNSTALLAARWPDARLEGLDNSEAMLAEARASGVGADWVLADIASWQPVSSYDLIFSNAAFQWLSGQAELLPRLMGLLAPGGVLAFQVPVNFDAPSHRLMREVASDSRWRDRLADVRKIERATAHGYYDMLRSCAAALDIWTTEYLQLLEGEDAVYRWVSGTGLRPFVDALEGQDKADFIAAYKARLNAAYPAREDGTTLFPFQRLFVVALKR